MRKFPYILLLLALLLSLGCDQIIEIDLPEHTPQLVVNGSFSPDSLWRLRISASQSIQAANEPVGVENAVVLILENGQVIDSLRHLQGDTFVSVRNLAPLPGHTYTVRVSAPNFETVSGTATVPNPVMPTSIAWEDSTNVTQWGDVAGEVTVAFDDPPGEHNYYMWAIVEFDTVVYSGDTSYWVSMIGGNSQDPELEYNYPTNSFLLDDENFDGRHREFKIEYYSGYQDSSVISRRYYFFSTISEAYYRYQKTLVDYNNSNGNPFAEPVRMYSNMTNGMGIFAGYSSVMGRL